MTSPNPQSDGRPHVFLSYSWSSHDHQQWVKKLAEELTDLNIHVLFDMWDLKTGDDTLAFMERSVNDPKVTKVLILADKIYVEKANGRNGGVGTETQIISPSIYDATDPGKFALVVCERDQDNKPYLPTYYRSKMYIDFSDPARYADEFDRLLRWIFNKPADVRPAYGATPSFVAEPDAITLGTDTQARRTLDALHTGKSTTLGAFTEYLSTCTTNLERFRIARSSGEEFDDQVVASIEALRPFRHQFLSLLEAVAVHTESNEYGARLHGFFEAFFQLTQRPAGAPGSWYDSDYDNFSFLLHEAFLSACALFIKKQRFDLLTELIAVDYYLPRTHNSIDVVSSHVRFSAIELSSLEHRTGRLKLKSSSLHADLLIDRASDGLLTKEDLVQTDLLLFLRSLQQRDHWYPSTNAYAGMNRPLEVFARAASAAFFERIRPVLGASSLAEFKDFVTGLPDRSYSGRFGGSYGTLVGLGTLGTRP